MENSVHGILQASLLELETRFQSFEVLRTQISQAIESSQRMETQGTEVNGKLAAIGQVGREYNQIPSLVP